MLQRGEGGSFSKWPGKVAQTPVLSTVACLNQAKSPPIIVHKVYEGVVSRDADRLISLWGQRSQRRKGRKGTRVMQIGRFKGLPKESI